MVSATFADRPIKKLVLFDVDDTLTAPRQVCLRVMRCSPHPSLSVSSASDPGDDRPPPRVAQEGCHRRRQRVRLRQGIRTTLSPRLKRCVAAPCAPSLRMHLNESAFVSTLVVIDEFDFTFGENGLTAYKLGQLLPTQSFIKFIGEDRYKSLANFILHYIADLDIPIKRCVSFKDPVSPMAQCGTSQRHVHRVP